MRSRFWGFRFPNRLQNDFFQSDRQLSCAVGFRQGALVSEVASVKATNAEMKQLIAALQEKSDKQVNMPAKGRTHKTQTESG